jgi:glycosyltransferase involved in cell wall biosynthesis
LCDDFFAPAIPLKILRIIDTIGSNIPSGPPRMAYNLTAGLARKGIQSTVYTNNSAEPFESDLVKVKIFKPATRLGHYRLNPSMFKDLLREEADIVHIHGYRNFESDAGALSAYLTQKPCVMTCHGTVLGPLNVTWSLQSRLQDLAYDGITMRFSLKHCDALVATTTQEAKEVASLGADKSKIVVVPNAVDLASVPKKRRREDGLMRVLLVSRLTYKNNIEMAIRGFAVASEKKKNLRLTIVGDESPSRFVGQEKGYKEKLHALCRELNLREDQVEFTGWLTGNSLWNAYLNSDVFLWTSRYDNFAHALVEAANFSLPIVSTDVGVASQIIGKNEGGFIVPQEDPKAVARALVQIAEDNDLRTKMGEQNKQKSLEFTVDKMVESYIKIYESLVDTHW